MTDLLSSGTGRSSFTGIKSARPTRYQPRKKIVSIVGGCGLNRDGQPNLLIIPGSTAATTCIPPASTGCPCFMLRPRRRAPPDQRPHRPDNEIRTLKKGGEFNRAVSPPAASCGFRIFGCWTGRIAGLHELCTAGSPRRRPVPGGANVQRLYREKRRGRRLVLRRHARASGMKMAEISTPRRSHRAGHGGSFPLLQGEPV